MAILVPKSHRVQFFLAPTDRVAIGSVPPFVLTNERHQKVVHWLNKVSKELCRDPNDTSALEDFKQICTMVVRHMKACNAPPPGPGPLWRNQKEVTYSDDVMIQIIETAIAIDCKNLFVDVLEVFLGKFTLSLFESVGAALLQYGLESLLLK